MSKESYRKDKNGWSYICVRGTAAQRGYEHGRLLAEEIVSGIREAKELAILQTGLSWDCFLYDAGSILHKWREVLRREPYLEFYEEMEAIAEGVCSVRPEAGITVDDIILWNGFEELTNYWLPTAVDAIYERLPGQGGGRTRKHSTSGAHDHCSAFIATGSYTADGRIVLAHNSFTPYENSNHSNVIQYVEPDSGYPFIMQSQPGYIHSMSDFYLTRTGKGQGLMISETTIGGFCAYEPEGVPEFARIRLAVQYADTLNLFVEKFWKHNNGGYANTWLVGDVGTNEIMRFEAGLKFFKVDKTTDGYYAGFNAPEDPRIRNLECDNCGYGDIRRHQGARQVRIPQLMERYKGAIDSGTAKQILSDHYDVYLGKENPCSRTVCSHYELDERAYMSQPGRPVPFQPRGAVDGLVAAAEDAESLALHARWGSSCGMPFYVEPFLEKHPQFNYLRPYLKDRPTRPWTRWEAEESGGTAQR